MKRIFLLSILSLLVISACKKVENNPNTVVTASFPKITYTQQFYSVNVGGVRPTVQATAYDKFYNQNCKIITIDSNVNTFVPGIYTATIYASNSYGFTTYSNYYVAVTSVASSMDLSGKWIQAPGNDSTATIVTKLANGFYSSNNVDGVNIFLAPSLQVSDYFVVTSNTNILFNSGNTATLAYVALPGVSSMSYTSSTGTSLLFSR